MTLRRLFRKRSREWPRVTTSIDPYYYEQLKRTNTPAKTWAGMKEAGQLLEVVRSDARNGQAEFQRWRKSHYDGRIRAAFEAIADLKDQYEQGEF